jgi:hypothetical protein
MAKLYRTRFSELGYTRIDHDLWRFVAMDGEAVVGPFYKTEKELLANLDSYASDYGCAPRAKDKLNIVVYHGEHRTLFYVVVSSQSDVDWTVIKTFSTRDLARAFIAAHREAWPADFE